MTLMKWVNFLQNEMKKVKTKKYVFRNQNK